MYASDRIAGATPIRLPSTANLMISSLDRSSGSSNSFSISKNNNILSGYFTRFGMVEIVLDWCVDNISDDRGNTTITFQIGSNPLHTATVDAGQYTVESLLDALVDAMNDAAGEEGTFSVVVISPGQVLLGCTNPFTIIDAGNLPQQLNLLTGVSQADYPITCPNLVTYTYLDFVCTNLTYQQELKDGSTAGVNRDVIYRWVMGWEGPSPVDGYGYPIFQGMQKFVARRYLSFPKQIKWDAQQPLGQLQFEVFEQNGTLVPITSSSEMEFYMTLLVSEQ